MAIANVSNASPLGPGFQANFTAAGNQENAFMVMSGPEHYYVFWNVVNDIDEETDLVARRFNLDGSEDFIGTNVPGSSEYTFLQIAGQNPFSPTAAEFSDGRVIFLWNDGNDNSALRHNIIQPDGAIFGPETTVDLPAFDGLPVPAFLISPSIVVFPDDSYLIVGVSTGTVPGVTEAGIYAQRYNADHTRNGDLEQIDGGQPDTQFSPNVTLLDGGGYVITWLSDTTNGELMGRVFSDASGTTASDVFQLNTGTDGIQVFQSITATSNGGFLATWTRSGTSIPGEMDLIGRYFSASGTAVGPEFNISSNPAQSDGISATARTPDGGMLVIWAERDADAPSGDPIQIVGQRLDSAGETVGDQFIIGSVSEDNFGIPSILVFPDGGFVVSFSNSFENAGVTDGEVFSRVYDAQFFGTNEGEILTDTVGADHLNARGGDDTITGGTGDDLLTGGGGADIFVVTAGQGHDIITDFSLSEDSLQYSGTALQSVSVDGSGNRLLTMTDGSTVTLQGIARNSAVTGAVTISGSQTEDSTLTLDTSGIGDADGLGAFSIVWLRDGTLVSGATSLTYDLTQADVGAQMTAVVSYVDGYFTGESTSSTTGPIANVNDDPSDTYKILGKTLHNKTLRVDPASVVTDEDGIPTPFEPVFQWYRGTKAVQKQNGETYELSEKDVGEKISFSATYTDKQGTVETVFSDLTSTVEFANLKLTGNKRANELDGSGGNDKLSGKGGADQLRGFGGDDKIVGGGGSDTALGGDGNDILIGKGGKDKLRGGDNNDRLSGGSGADNLKGDAGRDTLTGGGGGDRLEGGTGNDQLTGNGGADLFVFARDAGKDTITDMDIGVDQIEIGLGASKFKQLSFKRDGADVIVQFSNVKITVEDTKLSDLADAGNFLFV